MGGEQVGTKRHKSGGLLMAKVRYTGQGSENDKRTMKVSDAEADRLEAKGLWKRVAPRTKKKEGDA